MQTKSDASNTTDRPANPSLGSNSSRANARCKGAHHTTPSDAKNVSEPYNLLQGRCVIDNCLDSIDGQCVVCNNEYGIENGRCVSDQ